MRTAVVALLALLAGACGPDREAREGALDAVLDSERRAHLEVDAQRLAATIADSMLVVADGSFFTQSRDEVSAQFTAYFRDAEYRRWDDVVPPVKKVSSDGTLAQVHRHVRVERLEPGLGTAVHEVRFQSAWTATYGWTPEGWRMTSVTSTFPPVVSAAEQVVAGARRRVGVGEPVEGSTLRAVADVEGPTGPFRVAVHSSASGAARIDFHEGPSLSAFRGGGWTRFSGTESDSIPASELSFLRGHEVHLTLLRPASRLDGLSYAGRANFLGEEAIRLVGRDAMGSEAEVYYRLADTLPLGFTVVDHMRPNSPPVQVATDGWGQGEGADALAGAAVFRQGGEAFRYSYVERSWLPPETELFRNRAAFDFSDLHGGAAEGSS